MGSRCIFKLLEAKWPSFASRWCQASVPEAMIRGQMKAMAKKTSVSAALRNKKSLGPARDLEIQGESPPAGEVFIRFSYVLGCCSAETC